MTLFFVLSGFLIFWNYFDSFALRREWFYIYFRNRYARIFPAYWTVLLISEALIARKGGVFFWFLNITLLKAVTEKWLFIGIGPSWSLGVEEFFYVLCPLLFLIFHKKREWPVWLSLVLGLQVTGQFLLHYCRNNNLDWLLNSETHLLFYTFFGRCFEFLVGGFLAVHLRRRGVVKSGTTLLTYAGIGLTLVIWIAMMLLQTNDAPSVVGGNFAGLALNSLALPIGFLIIFLGLILEQTAVRRLLSSRVAVLLGKSSYVFYLVHFSALFPWLLGRLSSFGQMGAYFSCFLLLQLFSVLIFKGVEEPCNSRIKKLPWPLFTARQAKEPSRVATPTLSFVQSEVSPSHGQNV